MCRTGKEKKYSAVLEGRRASFTPFIVSVYGILGHDAMKLLALGDQIALHEVIF